MRIRTTEELQNKIENEISWRIADLVRLRSLIIKGEGLFKKTLLRSAIPILYAHWEGFVKEAAQSLFFFIAARKLTFKELTKGLLATYIGEKLISTSESTYNKGLAIIELFEEQISSRSNINSIPKPINTKSNLNSSVLKEIVGVLELDYEKFRGYENLIDGQLLEARNKIAHGEYREISWQLYDQLHNVVIELMRLTQTEILNCVASSRYKRVHSLT